MMFSLYIYIYINNHIKIKMNDKTKIKRGSHDRNSSITGNDWLQNETSVRVFSIFFSYWKYLNIKYNKINCIDINFIQIRPTGRRQSRTMDHPANSEEV